MQRLLQFIFAFILGINSLFAQNSDVTFYLLDSISVSSIQASEKAYLDSLLKIYHKPSSTDTVKLDVLHQLSENLSDQKTWSRYNELMIKIATEKLNKIDDSITYKRLNHFIVYGLNNKAYQAIQISNYESALKFYDQSRVVLEKIHDKKGLAVYYNGVGYIYMNQGDIQNALNSFTKSLQIKRELGDLSGAANTLNNIGYIYNDQYDYESALHYFEECASLRRKINDQHGLAYVYGLIGYTFERQENRDSSLHYYIEALKLSKAENDLYGLGYAHNSLADFYLGINELDSAETHGKRSLNYREQIKDKTGVIQSKYILGGIALKQNEYQKAEKMLSESYEQAMLLGFPKYISNTSYELFKLSKQKGNHKEALEYYELHIQMRDSLKNDETQKATIRQHMKYEFEKAQLLAEQSKKEELRIEEENLKRRNALQYSGIFVFVLILFAIVFMSGNFSLSERMAEGLIFFTFLLLFEFCLVLLDPTIDRLSSGEPLYKLLFNAILAAGIFPLHAFFESTLKRRILKK